MGKIIKKHTTSALVFECKLPPKMPHFARLSDFILKRKKIKHGLDVDIEKLIEIHGAVGTKHAIARINFVKLKSICEEFYKNLTVEQKKGNILTITMSTTPILPIISNIDNFVNEIYGSLDFFSRELDEVLGTRMGIKSDFEKVCGEVKNIGGDDELSKKIQTFYDSNGYKYLHALRIRTIHWFPLSIQIRNRKLLLPDKPFEDSPSPKTEKGFEIISKSEELLYHTLGFINDACDSIGKILFKDW